MSSLPGQHQNQILAALPAVDFARLAGQLELVSLRVGDTLYDPGEPLQYAYFPTTAIVSLHLVSESSTSVEISGVGNDGMVGVSLFMGGETTSSSATVRTSGYAYRLEAHWLKQEFDHAGPMRDLLLRYSLGFMAQIGRAAVCNRHHSLEQHLCTWLLMSLDRSLAPEFTVTQSLVAVILGVPAENITGTAARLQQAGYIRYRRSHLTVGQRAGLESCACECYAVGKQEMQRLLFKLEDQLACAVETDTS